MVKKLELSDADDEVKTDTVKAVKKTKKERSEKQIEAFKKGQEKLKQINAEKKRQKELHLAKVLEEERNKTKPEPIQKVKKPIVVESEDDEPDEEVIIVEKKKKPKKTVKRIIVEETSSESDNSTVDAVAIPVRKEKQFKSQQNKKSMIKIGSNRPSENPTRVEFDYTKYFT